MKYALLGADAESCLLAQAAADLGHENVWCGDLALLEPASNPWLAGADKVNEWEVLCDRQFCDFVIVGSGDTPADRRIEQLIQIVKNEVNVITSFPLSESVLSYYEVDMARGESGAVLHHFNPLVSRNDRLEEFASWIVSGHPQLGRIEQLVCERPLAVRSRDQVLWHFARDVELIDSIAGPLDRLGALGSPDAAATYSGLSVQLLGNSQVPVQWSVGPIDQSTRPVMNFVAQHGRARLEFDESGIFRALDTSALDEANDSPARRCMEQFTAALTETVDVKTTWPAALRAMELADTIEISLRRGRMIDVHRQQLTEELSFRGTMSAVGCGVLLLLPPLMLLAGWLAEVMGMSIPRHWWAYLLLALLGLFLLIQVAPQLLLKKREQ